MNILAIGAHPDDIEYGCAGTLLKYAEQGHDIYGLVVTGGEFGGSSDTRHKEQEQASKILKIKKLFWGGYKDTELPINKKLIDKLEETIKLVKPTFIFINYFDDTHQDHRHLSQCTISATRLVKNVIFYEVPTSQNFTPNVFVDIDDTFERKLEALKAHSSQVNKTNITDLNILEMAKSTAHFRGTQARVKFAEGFHSLRLFINIDQNL